MYNFPKTKFVANFIGDANVVKAEIINQNNNTYEIQLAEMKINIEQIENEAKLLRLDCSKAAKLLNWQPLLNFQNTIKWTGDWYKIYYEEGLSQARNTSINQIKKYIEKSINKN